MSRDRLLAQLIGDLLNRRLTRREFLERGVAVGLGGAALGAVLEDLQGIRVPVADRPERLAARPYPLGAAVHLPEASTARILTSQPQPTRRAKRIYPRHGVSPVETFNVLLLAEGFRSAEEPLFNAACQHLADRLVQATPFNLLKFQQNWLNVYRGFTPSNVAGPAIGSGLLHPAPGDTAFGSTYNTTTGELKLDPKAVYQAVLNTVFRDEQMNRNWTGAELFWLDRLEEKGGRAGVVIVLLPGSHSAEMEYPFAPPDEPRVAPPGETHFTATTTDGDWWHQVVVHAIARVIGLGAEYELSGPDYLAPTATRGTRLNAFPNLIYADPLPANLASSDLKWYAQLSAAERTGLQVVPHPDPSKPNADPDPPRSQPIQLIEGGGGYRTKVYRSAHDCLMRRQIDGPLRATLPLKGGELSFCPICQRVLTHLINGSYDRAAPIHLHNQLLLFDRIAPRSWTNPSTIIPAFSGFQQPPGGGFTRTVTSALTVEVNKPTPRSLAGPHWEFKLDVGPNLAGGLQLREVKLMNQPMTDLGVDVAKLIDFRDLSVTFDDGTPEGFVAPFNVAAAFTREPVLAVGVDGELRAGRKEYLWGIKFTMEDQVNDHNDVPCPVRVEISFVVTSRGSIEPIGLVQAVKFFPQIAMTWSNAGSAPVRELRGTVRIVANNHALTHAGGTESGIRNIVNLFADSNAPPGDTRRLPTTSVSISGAPLIPHWANTFDYYRPNLPAEYQFIGVHAPARSLSGAPHRLMPVVWPPGGPEILSLLKLPRQGAFDNVHISAYMGDYSDPTIMPGPIIHAPACAEACLHLHWRWGTQIPRLAAMGGALGTFNGEGGQFKGWSRRSGLGARTPYANNAAGAPLIPPNQQLTVAITNAGTTRSSRGSVISSTPPSLHPIEKAIWYTVDVIDPRSSERQVILEQGIGWGFSYLPVPPMILALMIAAVPGLPVTTGQQEFRDLFMPELYEFIRWFSTPAGVSQIPLSSWTSGATAMEAL